MGKKVAISKEEEQKQGDGVVESEDRWDLARLLSEVDARMLKQKQASSSAVPGRSSSSSSARRSSTEQPSFPSSSRAGGVGRSTREIAPASTSSGQGMATRSGGKGKERMRSLPTLPVVGEIAEGSSSSSSTDEIKIKSAPPLFDDYLNLGGMNEPMDDILEDDGGVGKSLSSLKMKDPSTSPPPPPPRLFHRTTSLQLQQPPQPPPRTHLANPPPLLRRTTSPIPPPSPRKPRASNSARTTNAAFSPPPLPHHRTTKALSPLKQLINSSNSQQPSSSRFSNTQQQLPPPKPNPSQGGTRSSGPVTVGIPRRPASSLSKDPRRTFRPPFLKQPQPNSNATHTQQQHSQQVLAPPQPSPPKAQEEREGGGGGGGNAPSSDGPRVDSDNSFDSFDALLLGESEDIEALLRVVDGI